MQGLGSFTSMEGGTHASVMLEPGLYITRAKRWRKLQKRGPRIPAEVLDYLEIGGHGRG